jgi:hypothetical protein
VDGVWVWAGGEDVYLESGAELTVARSAYDKATSLLGLLSRNESIISA